VPPDIIPPVAVDCPHPPLLERIRRLSGDQAPQLPEVEQTLTDGYVEALALEGERLRLERRLEELATAVGGADSDVLEELPAVARRMSLVDTELTELRSVLAQLRDRASAIRAA
jgi:hypothetical protein